MKTTRISWVAGLLSVGGLLTGAAFGQGNPCPEPDFLEAWVDPLDGNDGTGLVDDPTLPYQTINAAIAAVSAARQAIPNPADRPDGLVHGLPGVYTDGPGIGSQNFPVMMQPYVHVQGAGAKECVLRVRPSGASTQPVLWPLTTGLTYNQATIAVDFRQAFQLGQDPSMFDGFTIQGADVQVHLGSELHPIGGRVSNCVFDMRDGGAEMLSGPYFGVLVGAIYLGEEVPYQDMDLRLFNNTFVQGVSFGDDGVDLSRPESVAICNCNDPSPPPMAPIPKPDPIQLIRGVSDLHIQNNVIRCLDEAPRTAMLGIDQGDTRVVVSSRGMIPYDTNAFDPTLVGGTSVDPAGMFTSEIWTPALGLAAPPPAAAVDLGPADPGFVGEYLTELQGVNIRDARILPDSVLVDMGATPAWPGDCLPGAFVAENGRVHLDARTADVVSSFVYDGDGHGNERVVGADIDIGMDEVGQVTLAGSYGNDTKSHHLSYDPQDYGPGGPRLDAAGVPLVQIGTPDRDYFFAGPTTFWLTAQFVGFDVLRTTPGTQEDVWVTTGAYTHMPGSVAFPVNQVAPGAQMLPSSSWIDYVGLFTAIPDGTVATTVGSYVSTPDTWTNPESGQVHVFERFRWSVPETLPAWAPVYFTSDLQILTATGFVGSNLLAEYL